MTALTFSSIARLGMATLAITWLAGCAHVRDDDGPYRYETYHHDVYPYPAPRVAYFDYWYYPALGCYYDTRTRVYIYYERDRWVRARALPPHLRPHLGSHVTVRAPQDRPYEYHHRHREQYAPERYRRAPDLRRDDVWLGPPRQAVPPRDRGEPRRELQQRQWDGRQNLPREQHSERRPAPAGNATRMEELDRRQPRPDARITAAPVRQARPVGEVAGKPATPTTGENQARQERKEPMPVRNRVHPEAPRAEGVAENDDRSPRGGRRDLSRGDAPVKWGARESHP